MKQRIIIFNLNVNVIPLVSSKIKAQVIPIYHAILVESFKRINYKIFSYFMHHLDFVYTVTCLNIIS